MGAYMACGEPFVGKDSAGCHTMRFLSVGLVTGADWLIAILLLDISWVLLIPTAQ
jgi:hypothetical protein